MISEDLREREKDVIKIYHLKQFLLIYHTHISARVWRDDLVVKSVFTKYMSSVPSTHIRWLTATYDSNSMDFDAFFCPLWSNTQVSNIHTDKYKPKINL